MKFYVPEYISSSFMYFSFSLFCFIFSIKRIKRKIIYSVSLWLQTLEVRRVTFSPFFQIRPSWKGTVCWKFIKNFNLHTNNTMKWNSTKILQFLSYDYNFYKHAGTQRVHNTFNMILWMSIMNEVFFISRKIHSFLVIRYWKKIAEKFGKFSSIQLCRNSQLILIEFLSSCQIGQNREWFDNIFESVIWH